MPSSPVRVAMEGIDGNKPKTGGEAIAVALPLLVRAHLILLRDDCRAGLAALEHRESVAAGGHVVAPLPRGYTALPSRDGVRPRSRQFPACHPYSQDGCATFATAQAK